MSIPLLATPSMCAPLSRVVLHPLCDWTNHVYRGPITGVLYAVTRWCLKSTAAEEKAEGKRTFYVVHLKVYFPLRTFFNLFFSRVCAWFGAGDSLGGVAQLGEAIAHFNNKTNKCWAFESLLLSSIMAATMETRVVLHFRELSFHSVTRRKMVSTSASKSKYSRVNFWTSYGICMFFLSLNG